MADVDLRELSERFLNGGSVLRIIEAAASVANAIHLGLGPMVKGTMMESELREALRLKPGELVNIPKHSSASAEGPK